MQQFSGPGKSLLRFLTEPSHVNFGGKVHGGMVMKWIDQAGYTCAAQLSGTYCVTVYVGSLHFLRPIMVGSAVDMRSQVIHTGRSSMHIFIDIFAGDPRARDTHRCAYCLAVFVALDVDGRPTPVPPWVAGTEREKALERYALRLVEHRKQMDAEAAEIVGVDD
jgi:uncharacterized protein (TIGR00369 family)